MGSIFKKATGIVTDNGNVYECYNLKENPFPLNPFLNQESTDKRYNGDIYEASVRDIEEMQVEESFLKVPQSNPSHIRVGYILDTSYVGRGNGKSSFAINLIKRINNSYCLDITNETNKCFGLYLTPDTSGRTRSFSNLLDIWAEAIFNAKVIDYALASLRVDAIVNIMPDKLDESELENESALIESLNNLEWYNKKNIYYDDIHAYLVKNNDFYNKISSSNPLRKRYSNTYSKVNFKIITSVNIQAYYQELKKDSEKIDFIFNDMVYLFLASGFNGAYIIVDDFERIPDFQSDRQKRDFALEIRRNFFDGTSANARIGFYNLLLMLHAGVPRLIEKAWSESGMEQRSSISPSSAVPHIIYFNKLDKNRAILLIKKYLTEYRINKEDSIQPFTESAIAKIGEEKEYNAAQMLGLAYMLLENAAKNNIKTIDVAEVTHMLKKSEIEVKTAENIIDENSSDLLNKANQE